MTVSHKETSRRPAKAVFQISPADRDVLNELAQAGEGPIAQRSRILLASDDGLSAAAIFQATGASRSQVYYWRRRYRQGGVLAVTGDPIETASSVAPPPDAQPALEKKARRKKKNKAKRKAILAAPAGPGIDQPALPSAAIAEEPAAPEKPTPAQASPALIEPRPAMGLDPSDNLAEAGRKVFSFFLARMLHHEPGTRIGEDIEELHDMRVATRRMRAAFDIFGTAYKPPRVKTQLKGLRSTGRALGAVRDWDVFLDKAKQDIHELDATHQEKLGALIAYWQSERETARLAMLAYLDSETYRQFVVSFNNFIQSTGKYDQEIPQATFDGEPMPVAHKMAHLAPVLIYTRLGAVRAFAESIPHAKIVHLHALRIQFKSLHYILDFLKEILGPQAKEVLSAVKRMQDHLGDLNDADVACLRLSALLENWESNQLGTLLAERQTPESLLAYLSLKHRHRHDLLVSFPAAWEAFDTVEFRRKLAEAVVVL
jgi:CHAD domain-containing protein/transposase-like protein